MAQSDFNETLQTLCEIDSCLSSASSEQSEIVEKQALMKEELEERRQRVAECEEAVKQGTLQQVLQEHSLRDEQAKIVQRRKQLTGLGGAKAGKLLEREVETASKTLEAMEERAMKAIEEVDELETELESMKSSLQELEEAFETDCKESEDKLSEVEATLSSKGKERDGITKNIAASVLSVYERVNRRYPGDAVALARNGACRSCFRALPAQTYNDCLVGGRLIQCPGCNRILVAADSEQ